MSEQNKLPAPEPALLNKTKKSNLILVFGILSVLFSIIPLAGIVFAVLAICLFVKNRSGMKAEIGKTLALIGIVISIIASAVELLFFPLNNPPSWLSAIRSDFLVSSFWIDFENNFISEKRYMYILKGLGVTFEVTFFAVLLGIALGVVVALVRSS